MKTRVHFVDERMLTTVHLIKGTNADGEAVEEFFFSESKAEWEAAALEVHGRPHEKILMSLREAIERYGVYFKLTWISPGGEYHEEVWKEFFRAEEKLGNLLFSLP